MRLEGIDILGPGRPDITGGANRATPIPLAARPFPDIAVAPAGSNPTATRHTVREGENLTRIVRQFLEAGGKRPANTDIYAGVLAVARANNLSNPDLIYPGQSLDLGALATPAETPAGGIPLAAASPPPTAAPKPALPESAPPLQPADPLIGALHGRGPDRVSASAVASLLPAETESATAPDALVALGGPGRGRGDAVLALQRLLNNTSNALHMLRGIVQPDRGANEPAPAPGPWAALVEGSARLSSEYGMRKDPFTGRMAFHDGIDLAVKRGTPITAARPGVVAFSGWKSGYGNTVIIQHEDGLETLYAHAARTRVDVGDPVTEGAHIADSGSSGRSTGPHLHFEVRRHGRAVDPMPYLETAPLRMAQAGN